MTLEEASGPPVEVWPDNWVAVDVFTAMQTQWRTGMAGPIGIDYGALLAALRLMGIARGEWSDIFAKFRKMEAAALDEMRKK